MRKVVVMSGISGSGKSTYADKLCNERYARKASVMSADHYFMKDGEYQFDVTKLSLAHADCFRRFIVYLAYPIEYMPSDTIVVDNTNTTVEEISPYMLGAAAFGYEAEIITLHIPILLACERNVHGVGEQAIAGQFNRLAQRRLPPWWKNTDIQAER